MFLNFAELISSWSTPHLEVLVGPIIKLGQMVGSDVFNVVESAEKKILILDRSDTLDDHVFHSRDGSLKGVIRMNDVKGADVMMKMKNSVASEAFCLIWKLHCIYISAQGPY